MGLPIVFAYRNANVDLMDTPGKRIRELRNDKRLNQVALAKLAGIDQSTLSDIERGAGFGAEILIRIAAALESPPEFIMTGATRLSWPFSTIPIEKFEGLSDQGRGYVEAKLEEAIDAWETRREAYTAKVVANGRASVVLNTPSSYPSKHQKRA